MKSINQKERILNHKSHQNLTNDILKKQSILQKQVSRQYLKFKKSASQPSYFLNKSRLKRLSDIYRAASLEKLSRHTSFHNFNSKSIHNSITPEKKNTALLNNSSTNNNSLNVKKNNAKLNSLNLNNLFENTEKTKRLTLNRQNPKTENSHSFIDNQNPNLFKILLTIIKRLEEISHMTFQKVFLSQYNCLFDALNNQLRNDKKNLDNKLHLIPKFCSLIGLCQNKKLKYKQIQIKLKYEKMELQYSNTVSQLKKKSLKMQIMSKQLERLKAQNTKILKDINQLKEQKRNLLALKPPIERKQKDKKLQINQVIQLTIFNSLDEVQTPIYQHKFTQIKDKKSAKSEGYANQKISKADQICINISSKKSQKNIKSQNAFRKQKLEFISKIRALQKKQKDLMKTLLVLKSDGIDVERAFQEVLSGQGDDIQLEQHALQFTKKTRIPKYIRNIKNKDQFEADSSYLQSIDGLSLRYVEGEIINQQEIFYPIKHEYKSKPLSVQMKNILKLNFNVLYEDYEYCDDTQNYGDNQEPSDSDTG